MLTILTAVFNISKKVLLGVPEDMVFIKGNLFQRKRGEKKLFREQRTAVLR